MTVEPTNSFKLVNPYQESYGVNATNTQPTITAKLTPSSQNVSFNNMLSQFIGEVNAQQVRAQQIVQAVLTGENIPLHHAVIAVEEASIAFQLMVEIRNKLLDSYHELMRLQI